MNTRFQAVLEAAAEQWQVPAAAVAVDLGGAVHRASVGCDGSERFRIASITKPTTAILALSLLDLDEPTGIWPEEVRVRHLLSNTTGYDHELPEPDQARFGDGDDALARCVAELPAVRRLAGVDEVWSYANTGFWLAAHLAAERAGAVYEDLLREQVLQPLGLEAMSFDEPDLPGSGPGAELGGYPRARRPSGGLVARVDDVLRLGRHIASDACARMRVVHGKPVGGVYGLGLFGERVAGVDVWGHSGSYGGFQSSVLALPSHGAVFAGVTSSAFGSKALRLVEDVFFEHVVGERRATPSYLHAGPGELERHEGTYENTTMRVEVEAAGDGLVLHLDGEEIIGLKIGPRTFAVPAGAHVHERFDFPRDGLGRFGSRLAERA
ncbi:MAG TPA: serine hydrolase domain-containing protein [Gaiellaceae bacterium]